MAAEDPAPPGWRAVAARLHALEREPDATFTGQWVGAGQDGQVVGPEPDAEALMARLDAMGVAVEDMAIGFVRPESGAGGGGLGGLRPEWPFAPTGDVLEDGWQYAAPRFERG